MKSKITIEPITNAYIQYELKDNHFTVLSTFVDESLRGQGVAKKLYDKLIKTVSDSNGTFSSQCSYITKLADSDNSIKNIYKK